MTLKALIMFNMGYYYLFLTLKANLMIVSGLDDGMGLGCVLPQLDYGSNNA